MTCVTASWRLQQSHEWNSKLTEPPVNSTTPDQPKQTWISVDALFLSLSHLQKKKKHIKQTSNLARSGESNCTNFVLLSKFHAMRATKLLFSVKIDIHEIFYS